MELIAQDLVTDSFICLVLVLGQTGVNSHIKIRTQTSIFHFMIHGCDKGLYYHVAPNLKHTRTDSLFSVVKNNYHIIFSKGSSDLNLRSRQCSYLYHN